ncbi:MAG: D-alanyl-D-alanine carboxypeptidase family protein [Bacillota bacterium]
MWKMGAAVVAAAFCVMAAAAPASAASDATAAPAPAPPPRISADAAVVIEFSSGAVLYEKRAHRLMHPASITKMMTAIIALERGYLGDVVTVSRNAAYTPGSSMGLSPGGRYLLEDLLAGLMIVSGNDAAVAIAEHLAGTEQAFVSMMNDRAREIGALRTSFVNSYGISEPGHLTTAYDLALMARHGLSIPYFAQLVSTRERDAWRLDRMWDVPLSNTNRLLWGFQGADGVKTGTTYAAGQCLCASATRDGMRIISVVLHADSRWTDSESLLEYAFTSFDVVRSYENGASVCEVPVVRGMRPAVEAVAASDLSGVIARGAGGTLRLDIDVERPVRAPVSRGQRLGSATLWVGDTIVASTDVVAAADVEELTIFRALAAAYAPALRVLSRLGVG